MVSRQRVVVGADPRGRVPRVLRAPVRPRAQALTATAADSLVRSSSARSIACRRCPRLVAWREEVARVEARGVRRRGVLGPAPPGVRRSCGARCSWSAWRRRPTAATARAGSSPATARATGCSRRCGARGWPTSPTRCRATTACGYRLLRHRRGALRAAGQPAAALRAGQLPAVPGARALAAARCA